MPFRVLTMGGGLGDAGLFDYVLISLIDILLPINRTEGELKISISRLDKEWKMVIQLSIKEDNPSIIEDFRKRIVNLEMKVIQMAVRELNGKLDVPQDDDAMWFELSLPV